METQMAIALDLGLVEAQQYRELERESYQVLGLIDRLLDSLKNKPAIISTGRSRNNSRLGSL